MRARDLERGVAAVEFAMVLLPLLIVVMGAIDWGWYFHLRHVVTNAAREGARFGATRPHPAGALCLESADQDAVRARVDAHMEAALRRPASRVTIECQPIGTTGERAVSVTVELPAERIGAQWSFVPATPIQIQVQMRWE